MSYQVFVSLVLHSFSFINKKITPNTQDSVHHIPKLFQVCESTPLVIFSIVFENVVKHSLWCLIQEFILFHKPDTAIVVSLLLSRGGAHFVQTA